ncbi:hypothetical protein N825_28265 [Skermanella stibiiresistens SB22]|uniref:DUF2946 domain-containing protein n=1 Tax=Skermanella stibiiresistens SB22 TaxID=1385369 RepID=W9H643_9PROT|nr:hypothetical protein [Skermanella stibiiresistens]EWY41529.1 hypothetical protein N825_28265 [Skermanella stibiiresistens SB22]
MALAAVCLLAVQLLLTGASIGFATRAAAAPTLADLYGASICSATGIADESSDGSGHTPDQPHLPTCCTAACAMFAPGAAPPPAGIAVAAPAVLGSASPIGGVTVVILVSSDHSPLEARAPPVAV